MTTSTRIELDSDSAVLVQLGPVALLPVLLVRDSHGTAAVCLTDEEVERLVDALLDARFEGRCRREEAAHARR